MEKILNYRKYGNIITVTLLFNEINLEQRELLKKELNALALKGEKEFIIDLSKVGFFSSLTIATLVFFAKEVRKNNGDVKLIGLSQETQRVVNLTKLHEVFKIYSSEQEAINSF